MRKNWSALTHGVKINAFTFIESKSLPPPINTNLLTVLLSQSPFQWNRAVNCLYTNLLPWKIQPSLPSASMLTPMLNATLTVMPLPKQPPCLHPPHCLHSRILVGLNRAQHVPMQSCKLTCFAHPGILGMCLGTSPGLNTESHLWSVNLCICIVLTIA